MKLLTSFNQFDDISCPVIIIKKDLTLEYCNETARNICTSLCRDTGILPFIKNNAEEAKKNIGSMSPFVLTKNVMPYTSICVVPFNHDKKISAFVFAENSFNIFKLSENFRDERNISEAFNSEYEMSIQNLYSAVDMMRDRVGNAAERDFLPYFRGIERGIREIDKIAENVTRTLRLQSLISDYKIERVDILRFFYEMNRIRGAFNLEEIEEMDGDILCNKSELTRAINDISDFLIADGEMTQIKVKAKKTGSHHVISFSSPVRGRKIRPETAFSFPAFNQKYTLFFARKIVESRGGNILFRKRKNSYECIISLKIVVSADYAGIIASDNYFGIDLF